MNRKAKCDGCGERFPCKPTGRAPSKCPACKSAATPATARRVQSVRPSVRPSPAKSPAGDVVARAQAWRSAGEQLRGQLVAERATCEGRMREIDSVLADLGSAPAPTARQPAKRANGKSLPALPLGHPQVNRERGIPEDLPPEGD